jgi:hypothetical protein
MEDKQVDKALELLQEREKIDREYLELELSKELESLNSLEKLLKSKLD